MAEIKFSSLTLDNTPGAGSYVPYVDPTEASTADQNKRILVSDLEGADGSDGTSALPVGYLDCSVYVDPDKFDLWNGDDPDASLTPADSTADFQAAFDAIGVLHNTKTVTENKPSGGVTALFPKGRYVCTGTITIPSMSGSAGLVIDMTNVEIVHRPQADDVSLFRTVLPADNNAAEALNDIQDMWTWTGGWFSGSRRAGQIGFELNCVSRLVMERVQIQNFDEGVLGRFVLHFKLKDSRVSSCETYGVRIEEDDDWTGGTVANAASNGMVFDNVRFYGKTSNLAQLRIAHSAHVVRDCTFEGFSPAGYNYEFYNRNTSVLTSKVENCWLENDAVMGHFLINTVHQFELDIQYSNSDSVVADIARCSFMKIKRSPWPSHKSGTDPVYKADREDWSKVIVSFDGSGVAGENYAWRSELWSNGRYPTEIHGNTTGSNRGLIIGSHGSRAVLLLGQPSGSTLGAMIAAEYEVMATIPTQGFPAAPNNTVVPTITGTATVGETLTAVDGTWDDPWTHTDTTYQWKRDAVDISGATAETYVLVGADSGTSITVEVTHTNYLGAASATSAGTAIA